MFKPLFRGRLVRLAAPLPEDGSILALWTNDDLYLRQLDDDPVKPLPPKLHQYGENDVYFHLRTLADERLIGFVSLFNIKWASQTAEMAMAIGDSAYRGKGYGSDALNLLLNYGFNELNLYRVGLTVMDYNAAAIRAYERAGFVLEGTQRGMILREGKRYDLLLYGILRDEWIAKQDEGD